MILPLVNRIQRWRLRRSGFASRRISTALGDMHTLEYEGEGRLPPLVVVHGICAEGAQFADTLLALRPHFSRIVVPDLPAHGLSEDPRGGLTPDTLRDASMQLLDQAVDRPSLVLGNSLGGLVTVRYALERTDRVRALYLSSPAGGREPDADFRAFVERLRPRSWADGARFAEWIHRAPPWHRFLIGGGIRDLFARPTMAGFVDTLHIDHLLSPEEIRALAMPVRVVWGKRDALLPRTQLDYYRAHLPEHAEVEEPDDWGHCPYLDSPGSLARSVLDWAEAHAE